MRHVGWAGANVEAEGSAGVGKYILARFLPRSGESRDDALSWEDSAFKGPAISIVGVEDGKICSCVY